jgi:hypothetical protein
MPRIVYAAVEYNADDEDGPSKMVRIFTNREAAERYAAIESDQAQLWFDDHMVEFLMAYRVESVWLYED